MYQAILRAGSGIAHIHHFQSYYEGKINRKREIIASLKNVFEWNQKLTLPFFQQKLLST